MFEPSTPRRIALYSIGTVTVSTLAYLGFVREVPPDVGTLLSGVQIHAGMAAAIPADSENREGLALRREQLDRAWDDLRAAEEQAPDDFEIGEWTAFLWMLEGDLDKAATKYASLSDRCDDPELRVAIQLREVQLRSRISGPEKALAVLDGYGVDTPSADLTRVGLLVDQGKQADAISLVRRSFVRPDADPMHRVSCVRTLRGLAGVEAAAELCESGQIRDSLKNYELARLKAEQEHTDNALGLLTQSLNELDEKVQMLFARERGFWDAKLGEGQVNDLMTIGAPAAPVSGG